MNSNGHNLSCYDNELSHEFLQLSRHVNILVLDLNSTIINTGCPPRIYRQDVVRSKFEQQTANVVWSVSHSYPSIIDRQYLRPQDKLIAGAWDSNSLQPVKSTQHVAESVLLPSQEQRAALEMPKKALMIC